ncbi:MAG: hypothetical protein MJ221_04360 [Bacilli bacterium]|nr:hypothetical protein [Bacilli bacterium]
MNKDIISNYKIKLFVRFLRQYDLPYNAQTIIHNEHNLEITDIYNWWVIYYDSFIFPRDKANHNVDFNFKRIYDLLWMVFLLEHIKDDEHKKRIEASFNRYFAEYASNLSFPIRNKDVFFELKTRTDVNKVFVKT